MAVGFMSFWILTCYPVFFVFTFSVITLCFIILPCVVLCHHLIVRCCGISMLVLCVCFCPPLSLGVIYEYIKMTEISPFLLLLILRSRWLVWLIWWNLHFFSWWCENFYLSEAIFMYWERYILIRILRNYILKVPF